MCTKDFVSRIQSLVTFDFPQRTNYIRESFLAIHAEQQQQLPHWPLASTRKKLIAQFWFREVALHFACIMVLASLVVFPFSGQWKFALPAIFISGMASLVLLILFNYTPSFCNRFLPVLDAIVAEQEQIIIARIETKKCKRTQFSIPTLTIIFYVFAKTSKLPLPASNDRSAELLNNLYGADKDKLKQNLSRLYKISVLSAKEKAEMLKGVETSRTFFEGLDFQSAKNILDNLELKLQKAG